MGLLFNIFQITAVPHPPVPFNVNIIRNHSVKILSYLNKSNVYIRGFLLHLLNKDNQEANYISNTCHLHGYIHICMS